MGASSSERGDGVAQELRDYLAPMFAR